jgi:hypothetical protein
MKTINTVLPVYNKLEKQCYERSSKVCGDANMIVPVVTPRHRLPSILWRDLTDGCATCDEVWLINGETNLNITTYFVTLPTLYVATDDDYFQYQGDTLNYLLPYGTYYLKFVMDNGYVYYSDWFEVACVYENLIEGWANFNYDTFTTTGTVINSAIRAAGNATAYSSNTFPVTKGESYTYIFYFNRTSGSYPTLQLYDMGTISNIANVVDGLNFASLTATASSDSAYLLISNATPANWAMTEVKLIRSYSEKYIKFIFYHSCNLGDLLYEDSLTQSLFLETETMEPAFPYVEKGQENGYGQFIPTFQRQEKNYIIRTKLVPQFIVDVLHRLKLHDTIYIIDLVGDLLIVKGIDIEHEWQFDDKYYALATITVDPGEEIVTTACCTDINECP